MEIPQKAVTNVLLCIANQGKLFVLCPHCEDGSRHTELYQKRETYIELGVNISDMLFRLAASFCQFC